MSVAPPNQSPFHCQLELPRDVAAPGLARRSLAACFACTLDPETLATAELLASELVTNAVVHGRGRITLSAESNDERLLVEVEDQGAGFERTAGEPRPWGGWGLCLVESESTRWGVDEDHAHVWFELARRGRGGTPVALPAGCAGRRRRS